MTDSARCFSAPGKALVAGGYLVLDKQYKAYAVALSTRMHSVVSGSFTDDGKEGNANGSKVTVSSPQFKEGTWTYEFSAAGSSLSSASLQIVDKSADKNSFLLSTIDTILTYVGPSKNADIAVTMYSDSAYHSQQNVVEKKSKSGKSFSFHNDTIKNVPKTGLGSSAGLVTVLTAALLSFYKPNLDLFSSTGLQTVHNLAQISHCVAQGKIGSGFDVGAATYGSVIYQRFDPDIIHQVLKVKEQDESGGAYQASLRKLVDSKWDMTIQKCDLPPKIRILMGDVNSGSETPKLVSKVLQWRKENRVEAEKLFEFLNFYNMKLISELLNLSKISIESPEHYKELISILDDYSLIQLKQKIKISDPIFVLKLEPLLDVIESISAIRKNLQDLTQLTGAEIEPLEQTILLDNCYTLPGVLGGVVPGAGGYDAICLLCSEIAAEKITYVTKGDEPEKVRRALSSRELHNQEEFDNVDLYSIDSKLFKNVSWLDLHEENKGLAKEEFENYIGLA